MILSPSMSHRHGRKTMAPSRYAVPPFLISVTITLLDFSKAATTGQVWIPQGLQQPSERQQPAADDGVIQEHHVIGLGRPLLAALSVFPLPASPAYPMALWGYPYPGLWGHPRPPYSAPKPRSRAFQPSPSVTFPAFPGKVFHPVLGPRLTPLALDLPGLKNSSDLVVSGTSSGDPFNVPPWPDGPGVIIHNGPVQPPPNSVLSPRTSRGSPQPQRPDGDTQYPFLSKQSSTWVWPDRVVTGALPSVQLGRQAGTGSVSGDGGVRVGMNGVSIPGLPLASSKVRSVPFTLASSRNLMQRDEMSFLIHPPGIQSNRWTEFSPSRQRVLSLERQFPTRSSRQRVGKADVNGVPYLDRTSPHKIPARNKRRFVAKDLKALQNTVDKVEMETLNDNFQWPQKKIASENSERPLGLSVLQARVLMDIPIKKF